MNDKSKLRELARKLFRARKSNDWEQAIPVMNEIISELARTLGVEAPRVERISYDPGGGGAYSPHSRTIIMSRISFMTLLHEFAHHLLHTFPTPDPEQSAVLWSHRMFYSLFPKLYMESREKGLFLHRPDIEKVITGAEL